MQQSILARRLGGIGRQLPLGAQADGRAGSAGHRPLGEEVGHREQMESAPPAANGQLHCWAGSRADHRLSTMLIKPQLVAWLLSVGTAAGATHWVDNRQGSDAHDGQSRERAFASIARAIKATRTSDTIALVNTGTPYREAIALARLGGTPAKPLVIDGNGATITGLRELPPAEWKQAGEAFERVGPKPYGWPYLVIDGRRVPPARDPDWLAPGEWAGIPEGPDKKVIRWRFRPAPGRSIADHRIEATLEESGLRIASCSYIVVRNLVSERNANDGFNIHGDCRGIFCENIEARENGDDGFSIHETIEAVVRNGHFHHNGSGIEDGNLARSMYSGIHVHDNTRLGVLFAGAFHSAVDALVYDNPKNFVLTSSVTKHLIGGPFSPLAETSVFLQNVVVRGGTHGVELYGKCRAMIVNSIISAAGTGIETSEEASLHLTKSIVANCGEWELRAGGRQFYGDYNFYFPGRFVVDQRRFTPGQWAEFQQAVGHNQNSMLKEVDLSRPRAPGAASPWQIGKDQIGPTAAYW